MLASKEYERSEKVKFKKGDLVKKKSRGETLFEVVLLQDQYYELKRLPDGLKCFAFENELSQNRNMVVKKRLK